MRTKELTVYSYSELSETAKEKARNWYIENCCDYEWYDFILEDWKEKLAEIGFTNAKIYFTGFWSQGDGACFDAECNTLCWLKNSAKKPMSNMLNGLLKSFPNT